MSFMEDTDHDRPVLRLITGGKQPPRQGNNWLEDLSQWTVFLAKNPSISKYDLILFQVREKYANSTVLIVHFPGAEVQTRYFSTKDFSNAYELYDILDDPGKGTDDDRRMEGLKVLAQGDADVTERTDNDPSGSSEPSEGGL